MLDRVKADHATRDGLSDAGQHVLEAELARARGNGRDAPIPAVRRTIGTDGGRPLEREPHETLAASRRILGRSEEEAWRRGLNADSFVFQ